MISESASKFIFSCNDIVQLQNYLSENPQLDITTICDRQGNNVLHHSALHNEMDMMRLFINHAQRLFQANIIKQKSLYKKSAKQEIQNWAEQQNPEGFTPFLYACYNGNYELIKYLLEIGVNFYATTSTGLNALHLAAQNNKVLPFIYLRDKIEVNSLDKSNSSSLHWASYLGSEEVVSYLLTDPKLQINLRDKDQQTPLFLAVMYGNTRIVRKLLMKGADRSIPNKDGHIPLQIAKESKFVSIGKMLNDTYSCWDHVKFYCNVKTQYKPKNRSFKIPLLFIITALYSIGLMNFFEIFCYHLAYLLQGCLFGLLLLIYFTLLRAPRKNTPKDYAEVMLQIQKKYCYECMRLPGKRSYHCDTCHICIQQYDHHCTWINNCVGKRNIARFIIFILLLIVSLVYIGTVSILVMLRFFSGKQQLFIEYFKDRQSDLPVSIQYVKIGLFIINLLISLFFFPVMLLLGVQIKNLLLNRTTFERFQNKETKETQSSTVRKQIQKNTKKISFKNCRLMCSETKASFSSSQSLQEKLVP